jgi:hypothetical protein
VALQVRNIAMPSRVQPVLRLPRACPLHGNVHGLPTCTSNGGRVVWVVYAGVVVVLARLALQLAECWRPDAMPILGRAVRCEACGVCNGARGVRVRGSGTESSTVERHGGSVSAHLAAAEVGGRVVHWQHCTTQCSRESAHGKYRV